MFGQKWSEEDAVLQFLQNHGIQEETIVRVQSCKLQMNLSIIVHPPVTVQSSRFFQLVHYEIYNFPDVSMLFVCILSNLVKLLRITPCIATGTVNAILS